MPDLPPYVDARDFVRVRAWVRGFQRDAVLSGWRGERRVYLRWRTDLATTSSGSTLGRLGGPTHSIGR